MLLCQEKQQIVEILFNIAHCISPCRGFVSSSPLCFSIWRWSNTNKWM